uniref:SCAN box domain-containing protein n=1 Tax=Rhodnius prolixus TaxID=13249 RepID=T1HQU6_RHOPR
MPFDLLKFQTSPSLEMLNTAKKDDLIEIVNLFEIPLVKSSMKKCEIKDRLIQFFLDKNIFEINTTESVDHESTFSELDCSNKDRLELCRLQVELEREKIHLRLKELEFAQGKNTNTCNNNFFDIARNIKLVPSFQEQHVDKYFLHFEKIACSLGWPQQYWTMLLQSVFTGKARDVYTQLSIEQSSSYPVVKEFILKAYELVPEAYRQKFRGFTKSSEESFIEFAREKEQLFDRWCVSTGVERNFDKLKQLVLMEEFKSCVSKQIRLFLEEKQVVDLETAAKLAEEYVLTHTQNDDAKDFASPNIN